MDQFEEQNQPVTAQNKKGNKGWGVLGFFIPLAGLILFLVWKNDRPADAKYAGIGALIGFIVNFVFSIVWGILIANGAFAGLYSGLGAITLL